MDRSKEQNGADSGSDRSFGEGHVNSPHFSPQQTHQEAVCPENYGGAEQVFHLGDRAGEAHAGAQKGGPVSSGAELLEFEVALSVSASDD